MPGTIEEQAESGVLKAVQSQSFTEKITALFKGSSAELTEARTTISTQAGEITKLKADLLASQGEATKLKSDLEKAGSAHKTEVEAKEKELDTKANLKAKEVLAKVGHTAVAAEPAGSTPNGAQTKDALWTEYGKLPNGAEKRAFYLKHQEILNS